MTGQSTMVFHVGRHRTFDMEEAVASATTLFWRGYDRTSLTDLTGALGIAPASFYFAFGSKEALFRQVVDRYVAFRPRPSNARSRRPRLRRSGGAAPRLHRCGDRPRARAGMPRRQQRACCGGDALPDGWHCTATTCGPAGSAVRCGPGRGQAGDAPILPRWPLRRHLAGGIALESRAGASRPELHDAVGLALQGFPATAQKPRITSSQRRPA